MKVEDISTFRKGIHLPGRYAAGPAVVKNATFQQYIGK